MDFIGIQHYRHRAMILKIDVLIHDDDVENLALMLNVKYFEEGKMRKCQGSTIGHLCILTIHV